MLMRIIQSLIAVAIISTLPGCGGQVEESDDAAIANQAESLERAANATTDQLIKEIEESAKSEAEPDVSSPSPSTDIGNRR